jgi:hypothetical protein
MKVLLIVFVLCVFFGTLFYLDLKSKRKNYNYFFKGKVENIYYDIKGIPSVTINQKSYYLSYIDWKFDHQIEKGDSLEKKASSFTIKLTKSDTGNVILFK